MNPFIFALVVLAAFVAGVVFHKYVVSEAASIKQHVTDAEARIRADVANLLKSAANKVS